MHRTTEIRVFAQDHLSEMIDDLRSLVHLESPSARKDLLDVALPEIRDWAVGRLGEPAHEDWYPGGANGDVLGLRWAGTAAGEVLFPVHYDTVWPEGTTAGWPFTVEGDRLGGPGTIDMKAGLVQAVWSVLAARHLGLDHPGVHLLLTGDEEIGSHASRAHIERAAGAAVLTLVTEPSTPEGHLKTRRKGMVLVDVHATGVESHAGLDPDAGASAVHALAALVPELTALADPGRGTTVNVGTFTGGTGRNVVAGTASCQVDIRIQDPAEQDRLEQALAEISSPDPRVQVVLEVDLNRPPMNPNAASAPFVELARQVAAQDGRDLGTAAVGGASDANFVAGLGLAVLDGLGGIGAGPHARHEHVRAEGLVAQVVLITGILAGCSAR